jgi:hypothetical protein
MSRFRDIKRQARRDLHANASVPALYIPTPSSDPIPVTVRIWARWAPQGELPRSKEWAQIEDVIPRILFMRDEVDMPRRNAVVSVEAGEAYRVDACAQPDDISIIADVTVLTATEAAGLPLPSDPDASP